MFLNAFFWTFLLLLLVTDVRANFFTDQIRIGYFDECVYLRKNLYLSEENAKTVCACESEQFMKLFSTSEMLAMSLRYPFNDETTEEEEKKFDLMLEACEHLEEYDLLEDDSE